MQPKKKAGGFGDAKIKQFAALIDSDSDSYGSQGGLKEKPKPVQIKKRGGKKRKKNAKGEHQSENEEDSDTEKEDENVDNGNQQSPGPGSEKEVAPQRPKLQLNNLVTNDDGDDTDLEVPGTKNNANRFIEEAKSEVTDMTPKHSFQDPSFVEAAKIVDRYAPVLANPGDPTSQSKRGLSPPMIREYDPNEENAKTRAKRRRDELKKREAVVEVDKTQYPDDPTPWKGRSSDFFIVHAPRRGTHKVLNNSQKEFLLIYYPDTVADPVSMMEFLQRQAQVHEEKTRRAEAEKQGAVVRAAQRKKRQRAPKYVKELRHVNEDPRVREDRDLGAVSFDALLHETKQADRATLQLHQIRQKIEQITRNATTSYDEAQVAQQQHSESVMPGHGYCVHCHGHLHGHGSVDPYSSGYGGSTGTLHDETAIQRQRIMQQICEAKKRQARMEAEEARRLRDEARRLAEQAQMLELESQRPLLEAKRLEEEATRMELTFSRIPRHTGVGGGVTGGPSGVAAKMGFASSQPPQPVISSLSGYSDDLDPYVMAQRLSVVNKRDQLIAEAQRAQMEIARLQQDAQRLEQEAFAPRAQIREAVSENMRPLYQALDNIKPEPNIQAQSVQARQQIAQQNLQQYQEQARKVTQERADRLALEKAEAEALKAKAELAKLQAKQAKQALEEAKKQPNIQKIAPVYEDYNQEQKYSEDSEESAGTPQPAPVQIQPKKKSSTKQKSKPQREAHSPEIEKDPLIEAADKEFLKAKKVFEQAQKRQQDAHGKRERAIQQQKKDIEQAQDEANKYFAELKTKSEDNQNKNERMQIPNNQQSGQEQLLKCFGNYIQRLKTDKKAINFRYHHRHQVSEFLGPILSGRIIQEFDESQGSINFHQYNLEDNFNNGHQEYFHKWRHLFLYEAYSFLMNSRWSKFTGSDIDLRNQMLRQQQEKCLCWKGYFAYKDMQGKFCCLKMLKEPLNVMNFVKNKNYSKIYDEPDRHEGAKFELNHCREEDLIVMSKFRINLQGQEDIKMATGGAKFLREVLSKAGVSFGFVQKCNTKTDNFVEVLVDGKYAKSFESATKEGSGEGVVFTRYCYFFESLLTSIREFKALKALEYNRMSPILTYPTLSLEYKDKMIQEYCETIEGAFQNLDQAPELSPKAYQKDEEKSYHQMNNYLIQNHQMFNKSQAKVLEQVIELPRDDVLLIQGPPGTGKTHTIIGIISMILSTRMHNPKQKIMVCAPSNAAIDQIILRIIEKGLIGLKGLRLKKQMERVNPQNNQKEEKKKSQDDSSSDEEYCDPPDLTQSLIRITSAEYQTETAIKKHTLEQRILKKLCIEKFGDLKKCIKELKEMINQMNDFDAWEEYADFPFCNKIKFKNYTKTLNTGYLKKVHNWGDPNLTREQQLGVMQQQLKTHERELNDFKSGQNMEQGNMEWKDAEKAIIAESTIICCTLSMAGSSKLLPFVNQFEYLIVDEACQSTEPSTLIPFQHCPKRVILVGDQQQLPATTFSGNSDATGYSRSLFERLLDSGFDKTMLTIQFRMHPKIRAFPSEQFYQGAITDHATIGVRSPPLTISNLARVFTSRIVFFDIQDSEEILDNKSKCNLEEADFTRILIDFMARKMSLQGTLKYVAGQIGVISPYKAQVRQLYERIEQLCTDQIVNISDTIEVNTVDAFQGSEKDIIIFNCVRSNGEDQLQKSLGFLLDERRLNVAITRPKYFLLIVGNADTLSKSDVWNNMVDYCQCQGKLITIDDRRQFENQAAFKKFVLPQFADEYH